MKKIFIILLTVMLLCNTVCVNAMALEPSYTYELGSDGTEIYTYADGSRLIITTEEVQSTSSARASATTVTKTKTAKYENSDGTVAWEYTLTATFSYVAGVSSTCTNASYTYTINDDSWHFSDGAATKSGNTANGVGTFKKKVLFVTTQTHNVDLTLTCDINGNVS